MVREIAQAWRSWAKRTDHKCKSVLTGRQGQIAVETPYCFTEAQWSLTRVPSSPFLIRSGKPAFRNGAPSLTPIQWRGFCLKPEWNEAGIESQGKNPALQKTQIWAPQVQILRPTYCRMSFRKWKPLS
jgi:hypothetical protein